MATDREGDLDITDSSSRLSIETRLFSLVIRSLRKSQDSREVLDHSCLSLLVVLKDLVKLRVSFNSVTGLRASIS